VIPPFSNQTQWAAKRKEWALHHQDSQFIPASLGQILHGFGQYYMGTGPNYMIASAVYRMTRPPLFVGGFAMLWGYFKSMVLRNSRYDDLEFREFLRAYHKNCLIRGKAKATDTLNHQQAQRWKGTVVR